MSETTIAHLTADRVVYRDLQPCDVTLPGLNELRSELGLPEHAVPRKCDRDYALVLRAIVERIRVAQGAAPVTTYLVLGDTDNDRCVAQYLREIGRYPAFGFIGIDQPDQPAALVWDGDTANANRWSLVEQWRCELEQRGVLWPQTAIIIDIDKTLLGPRGRNDEAINAARQEGAMQVAREHLGPLFNSATFEQVYRTLCQKHYHGFTGDNQDYVVYTTMLITGGVLTLEAFDRGLATGTLPSFDALLAATTHLVPPTLATLHVELASAVAKGDPTPFKGFRHAEFIATVSRMHDGRLVLCRELLETLGHLADQGALCIAASDKPAEASLPTAAQAAAGLAPLHQTVTFVG